MTIFSRQKIHLELILALSGGSSEDAAISQVAAKLCVSEETVREVISELTEKA